MHSHFCWLTAHISEKLTSINEQLNIKTVMIINNQITIQQTKFTTVHTTSDKNHMQWAITSKEDTQLRFEQKHENEL